MGHAATVLAAKMLQRLSEMGALGQLGVRAVLSLLKLLLGDLLAFSDVQLLVESTLVLDGPLDPFAIDTAATLDARSLGHLA